MWPNLQKAADLVTFAEKILNEKVHVLCSISTCLFGSFCRTLVTEAATKHEIIETKLLVSFIFKFRNFFNSSLLWFNDILIVLFYDITSVL